jgi:hypothetical protein
MPPAISLAQAQASLTAFLAAELALASGAQEYSIAGRAFKRAQLNQVHDIVVFYQQLVDRLSRNPAGPRVRRIVPLDC